MESQGKQFGAEYQRHSLIEFLLGDHRRRGWLDDYQDRHCSRSKDGLQQRALENATAA
jgi:hypothetical protein